MKFTEELERAAHKHSNGEMSWQRPYVIDAIRAIARAGNALLGGEVLMIQKDGGVWGLLPRESGPPGVYAWTVDRHTNEPWADYVLRTEKKGLTAVEDFSKITDLDIPEETDLYFNLTWVSEQEYSEIGKKHI